MQKYQLRNIFFVLLVSSVIIYYMCLCMRRNDRLSLCYTENDLFWRSTRAGCANLSTPSNIRVSAIKIILTALPADKNHKSNSCHHTNKVIRGQTLHQHRVPVATGPTKSYTIYLGRVLFSLKLRQSNYDKRQEQQTRRWGQLDVDANAGPWFDIATPL